MLFGIVSARRGRGEAHESKRRSQRQSKGMASRSFHMLIPTRPGARYSSPLEKIHRPRLAARRRSALAMTETELRLMAAPAIMGLSSTPNHG